MKLKINREIHCRILKCLECGDWIETFAESYRNFGAIAVAHVTECRRRNCRDNDSDDDIAESFTIITERKFEVDEYDDDDSYRKFLREQDADKRAALALRMRQDADKRAAESLRREAAESYCGDVHGG